MGITFILLSNFIEGVGNDDTRIKEKLKENPSFFLLRK